MNLLIITNKKDKYLHNNDGLVLITVSMIIIVMTMLGLSILGLNLNQIMVTESEIERIQVETIAMGFLHYHQAYMQLHPGTELTLSPTIVNGPSVQIQTTDNGAPGGAYTESVQWDITVTY